MTRRVLAGELLERQSQAGDFVVVHGFVFENVKKSNVLTGNGSPWPVICGVK